jgi:NAD(P)-dependent dehydrogenase (short-subunit alcohol dehydrogenase family)
MADERKLLVVGASSGIGKAIAEQAATEGWRVALAARRSDLLEGAVRRIVAETSPTRAVALQCDVTVPADCERIASRAAEALEGLDVVVYSAGSAFLSPVARTSAEEWSITLETNLVGAALVVTGALEHLRASAGRIRPTVVFVSTHAVARPFPGLVAYAASKAALDSLARGLRAEEPWLRVIDISMGDTTTAFADRWDPAAAGVAFERWLSEGYLKHRILEATEAADAVLGAVAKEDGPDDVLVRGEELPT